MVGWGEDRCWKHGNCPGFSEEDPDDINQWSNDFDIFDHWPKGAEQGEIDLFQSWSSRRKSLAAVQRA